MSNSSLMSTASQKTEKSEKDVEKVLSADPEEGYFNPAGGKSEFMLVNCGEIRLAVKVRCSSNQLYRVNPVHLFIEAGQVANLEVTRLAGPARKDKLILQFTPCTAETKDPKEFFVDLLKKTPNPPSIKINLKVQIMKEISYQSLPPVHIATTNQEIKPFRNKLAEQDKSFMNNTFTIGSTQRQSRLALTMEDVMKDIAPRSRSSHGPRAQVQNMDKDDGTRTHSTPSISNCSLPSIDGNQSSNKTCTVRPWSRTHEELRKYKLTLQGKN